MNTDSINNSDPPPSEFGGLDQHCDPAARCSTSLFRLLCEVAVDARLFATNGSKFSRDDSNDTLTLWSNRRGQNATEANTLALLSVWLVGGIVVVALFHFFGRAWWAWLIAIAATPLLTFLALQVYSIAAALCVNGISKLGVTDEHSRERSVLFVSLSGLTALALLALTWGSSFFLAAAVPWLLWSALNFLAWSVLLLRSLMAALRQ